MKTLYWIKAPGLLGVLFLVLATFGCQSVVSSEEASTVYYNLGNAYYELGKNQEAEKAYLRAMELNPDLNAAGYNLARVLLAGEKYDEAIEYLQDLLEKDPENQILLETLGFSFLKAEKLEESLELYKELLEYNPQHDNGLYNAGLITAQLGDTQAALSFWKAGAENKESPRRFYQVLYETYVALDSTEEALPYLELYVQGKLEETTPLILLSDLYIKGERFLDALTVLERLEGMESLENKGEIFFEKAKILLLFIEDFPAGITALTAAVEEGFKDTQALMSLVVREDSLYQDEIESFLVERKLVSPGMIETERKKYETEQ